MAELPRPVVRLTLRDAGTDEDAPFDVRLRMCLKSILRRWKMRLIGLEEMTPEVRGQKSEVSKTEGPTCSPPPNPS